MRRELLGLGDWSEIGKNHKSAPEHARGGALQNRGAPGVLARVPTEVRRTSEEEKQQEWHLCEHSPEHPDFGEHPREHSQEQFPMSDQSLQARMVPRIAVQMGRRTDRRRIAAQIRVLLPGCPCFEA